MLKNLKFIKIDYIVFFDFDFDISIIYNFHNTKEDTPAKIERLKADYNELVQEGDIYIQIPQTFILSIQNTERISKTLATYTVV